MVVTYYIKIFRTGADRHNGILMPLLLVVAEITRIRSKINLTLSVLNVLIYATSINSFMHNDERWPAPQERANYASKG